MTRSPTEHLEHLHSFGFGNTPAVVLDGDLPLPSGRRGVDPNHQFAVGMGSGGNGVRVKRHSSLVRHLTLTPLFAYTKDYLLNDITRKLNKLMVESVVDPFRDAPPPEVQAVRDGEALNWPGIEAYLRKHLSSDVELEGEFEVLQFPNGSANLTYMLRFGETELVFRRPPFGTLAPGAHDMKREYRVLSRLWQSFDRAPRAYLFCGDAQVAGADFFVMERRRGEVIRGIIPESMRQHVNVGRRVGFALIDAMAEFHLVDTQTAGLDDLGKPAGFVDRQLAGWKKRWDLVADAQHDAQMQALHERLITQQPKTPRVSLVHNDLKLDNCMFDPADPDRVIAFFDWDMTTLGDPLIDLGTLLNYWPDPKDNEAQRRGHDGMQLMGLPTRLEVIKRYGERTGLDVTKANWYEAFGLWKTATVMQQLHKRWEVGDSTDERMATINDAIPRLLASTDEALQSINS